MDAQTVIYGMTVACTIASFGWFVLFCAKYVSLSKDIQALALVLLFVSLCLTIRYQYMYIEVRDLVPVVETTDE